MTSATLIPAVEAVTVAHISALPYRLLARAEVSHDLVGEHSSLSLYALESETFDMICQIVGDPELMERDQRMRKFFSLMPRHWIKFAPGKPGELSEYYQLAEPSPSALRLFLKSFGAADAAAAVDATFKPLFAVPDMDWGLIVKRSGGQAAPRVSARIPTQYLGRTLQEMVRQGLMDHQLATQLRDTTRSVVPGGDTYISVDPLVFNGVAIDIPSPNTEQVEAVTHSDLTWLQGTIDYLKVRFPQGASGPARYTIYRPAINALPSEASVTYVERVKRYYNEMTPVIEETFGGTYQAGLLQEAGSDYDSRATTLGLIARSGLRDEPVHLLDLGCGLAGPAVDIAQAYPNVRITAVNISPTQVERARELVGNAGLSDRITVVQADFHQLPFETESFDGLYAFEALCYTHDHSLLAKELARVVRPGGWLYAKELVRLSGQLNSLALEAVAVHDRTYAMRTSPLESYTEALQEQGWTVERAASIDDQLSTEPFQLRMFNLPNPEAPHLFQSQRPSLSTFGKSHFNDSGELPLVFAEILARKGNPSELPDTLHGSDRSHA